jgi:hypothetical protein
MQIHSGRITPKFGFEVTLRNPTTEKEYTTLPKQVIRITKAYPEFKKDAIPLNQNTNININNNNIDINLEEKRNKGNELTEKDLVAPIKTNSVKKQENQINNNNDNTKKTNTSSNNDNNNTNTNNNQEKILASEFKKEDLDDPDNIDNMMSLKVMEICIGKMDAQIKKIEGRPPTKLRSSFIALKCRYNTMKSQIEEGDISLQNYINILNGQITKDKRLANYFKQEGNKEKLMILVERIKTMMTEVDEGKKHLK